MRINPFDPATWLPKTGNPYIDQQLDQGMRTVGARGIEHLPANAQQLVETVAGALGSGPHPNPLPAAGEGTAEGTAPKGEAWRFTRDLLALRAGLLVAIGRRGSGKTAFDFMLGQRYADQGRPVFVVGAPQRVLTPLGFREMQVEDLGKLPNRSVLIIDDVALFFSTRDYARAGTLHKLIIESRHRDVVLLVNAHNTALVDKYLLEATALFLKPSSSLTPDLQRSGLRPLVQRADAAFKRLEREQRLSRIYAYSDELDFEGMLSYQTPRGWSASISKHHAGVPRGR